MKTLIAAIAIIIGICGFGYSDPGVWTGQHKPVNHIHQMLNHDANQPAGGISINSIANATVEKSGFTQTTDFIANGNIARSIGAK